MSKIGHEKSSRDTKVIRKKHWQLVEQVTSMPTLISSLKSVFAFGECNRYKQNSVNFDDTLSCWRHAKMVIRIFALALPSMSMSVLIVRFATLCLFFPFTNVYRCPVPLLQQQYGCTRRTGLLQAELLILVWCGQVITLDFRYRPCKI